MGQAKRRGDFETRKQQSIEAAAERARQEVEERKRQEHEFREWYNSLTPEQQEAYEQRLEDQRYARSAFTMWAGRW